MIYLLFPSLTILPAWQRAIAHWSRTVLPSIAVALSLAIACFSLGVAPAQATGLYDLPASSEGIWVLDEGNVLSRLTKGSLTKSFQDLADKTGIEVRAVTLRHVDYGETPSSLTQDLFDSWFPTPEASANQVVVAIDTATNGPAIALGNALGSAVLGEAADSIANETLLFPAREGNYNQAFLDARDRLVAILSGEPDPGPPAVSDTLSVEGTFSTAEETESNRVSATTIVIVLLIAATVIPMVTYFAYQGFS